MADKKTLYGLLLFTCILIYTKASAQYITDTSVASADGVKYELKVPVTINPETAAGIQLQPIDSSMEAYLRKTFVQRKISDFINILKQDKLVEYVSAQDILNDRISNYYLPYQNKIIRNIYYRRLDFNVDFSDTSKTIDYFGTKILSALHTTSKEFLIKNHMFIKKGSFLNPFVIADNERYLRTLHFIRDARILVQEDPQDERFVDIYVITKDLFSMTAEVHEFTANKQYLTVAEANLFGTGQSVSVSALREKERNPNIGANVKYFLPNLLGSFINIEANAGYITRNLEDHRHNVMDISLTLQRPLYSQYTRFIGDITIGKQKTFNNYATIYKQENTRDRYVDYNQNYIDASFGYNINAQKYISDNKVPDRNVVMTRYFNHHFIEFPEDYLYRYSDSLSERNGLLFQYTYFKQYFYKTSYILGFGTTEDMPAGINVSVTTGYKKINGLSRPYIGFDLNRYTFSHKSDIFGYFLRAGSYYAKSIGIEDLNFIGGLSYYSRLKTLNKTKFRHMFMASYAQQVNPFTSEPLRINNIFGLNAFREDSIMGEKRLSARSESFFFFDKKIIGFKYAPFLTADFSILDLNKNTLWKDNFYYCIGGGVRTRNENLQFGTIEIRFNYFPKKIYHENQFKIMIRSNLRFRYNSSYISKPRYVEYNSDIYQNIYQ